MKKLLDATKPVTFYRSPDVWLDPYEDPSLNIDLTHSRQSAEPCMLSVDAAQQVFVSIGERKEDWLRRWRQQRQAACSE